MACKFRPPMGRQLFVVLVLDVLITSTVLAAKVRNDLRNRVAVNEDLLGPTSRADLRALGKVGLLKRDASLKEEISQLKGEMKKMRDINSDDVAKQEAILKERTDKFPEPPPLRTEAELKMKSNISKIEFKTHQVHSDITGNLEVAELARVELAKLTNEATTCMNQQGCKTALERLAGMSLAQLAQPLDGLDELPHVSEDRIARMVSDLGTGLAQSEKTHAELVADAQANEAAEVERLVREVEALEEERDELEKTQSQEYALFRQKRKRLTYQTRTAARTLYAKRLEATRAEAFAAQRERSLARQMRSAQALYEQQASNLANVKQQIKTYTNTMDEMVALIKNCGCRDKKDPLPAWTPPVITTTSTTETTTTTTTTTVTTSTILLPIYTETTTTSTSTTTTPTMSTTTTSSTVLIKGFIEYERQQCTGSDPDMLTNFKGGVEDCKEKCLSTNCSGFVYLNSGPHKGTCTMRSGELSLSDVDWIQDNRDCWMRDYGDVQTTTVPPLPGTAVYNSWDVNMKNKTLGGADIEIYEATNKTDVRVMESVCQYTDGDHPSKFVNHMWCYPGAYIGQSNVKGKDDPDGMTGPVFDLVAYPPESAASSIVFRFRIPESGSYSVDLFSASRPAGGTGMTEVSLSAKDAGNGAPLIPMTTLYNVTEQDLATTTNGKNTLHGNISLRAGGFIYISMHNDGDGRQNDETVLRFRIFSSSFTTTTTTLITTTTSYCNCTSVCTVNEEPVRAPPATASCTTSSCNAQCSGYGCGFRCVASSCATNCSGDRCGYQCNGTQCASSCDGEECGLSCSGRFCAKQCSGGKCGFQCDSYACAGNCSGSECASGCSNNECGKYCQGYRCAYGCTGLGCAEGCVGDECGHGCRGEGCARGCVGINCAGNCTGTNCDANTQNVSVTTSTTTRETVSDLALVCGCHCAAGAQEAGVAYVNGVSMDNGAAAQCDKEGATMGTLSSTASICSTSPSCSALFDFNCDDISWRNCKSTMRQLAQGHPINSTLTEGCVRMKQTGWTLHSVTQVGASFQLQSTVRTPALAAFSDVQSISVKAGEVTKNKRFGLTTDPNDNYKFSHGRYLKLLPGGVLELPGGHKRAYTDDDVITLRLEGHRFVAYKNSMIFSPTWDSFENGTKIPNRGLNMTAKLWFYESGSSMEVVDACTNIDGTYSVQNNSLDVSQTRCQVNFTHQGAQWKGTVSGNSLIVPGLSNATVSADGVRFTDGTSWVPIR
eukprot:TRINITY_DN30279_c0_g1_i1.p1 TRINITY_DN30279_c0_g1~~TRINITY_DN30279_c0_g1_i1.p1  ORF type:complete len:1230 (+),score=176.16 TRINITY_DN30279_c0_g1_i1:100-3789(+)